MYRKRSKAGVSAIVGGAIVLAIFFIIIIPLLLLVQNSYATFLHESNLRRILDADRISESLEVEVSRNTITKELVLIVSNNGPISVKPVRVWAINVDRQTSITGEKPCLDKELIEQLLKSLLNSNSLSPGLRIPLPARQCVRGFTGLVQFLVITERGRVFSSNDVYLEDGGPIDIIFPHTLTVSIINMKKGRLYEVYVKPFGEGEVSPKKFTHKATASNENVTVAFGIFPGSYNVELYENGILVVIPEGNPQKIKVPDITAVIFTLIHTPYSIVNLQPIINAPSIVNKKKIDQIFVEIYVQLPKQANEPVEIIDVIIPPISIRGGGRLETCSIAGTGYILHPGQIGPIGICIITVNSDFTIIVDEGKIQGVGVITSAVYKNIKEEKFIKVVAD